MTLLYTVDTIESELLNWNHLSNTYTRRFAA